MSKYKPEMWRDRSDGLALITHRDAGGNMCGYHLWQPNEAWGIAREAWGESGRWCDFGHRGGGTSEWDLVANLERWPWLHRPPGWETYEPPIEFWEWYHRVRPNPHGWYDEGWPDALAHWTLLNIQNLKEWRALLGDRQHAALAKEHLEDALFK